MTGGISHATSCWDGECRAFCGISVFQNLKEDGYLCLKRNKAIRGHQGGVF